MAALNPTPPITPKLNTLTSNPQEPPSFHEARVTIPVSNGDVISAFKIPHGLMQFQIPFELNQSQQIALNNRSDLELILKAFRLAPPLDQAPPERIAEEGKNLPCLWPPNVMIHVNQALVRSFVPGQDNILFTQPIPVKRFIRPGQNVIFIQMTNSECICVSV